MNILKKTESREPCSESGWYAYDYELDRGFGPEEIHSLRKLGDNLIYLRQLKQPFYKLESQYMMIKGMEGQPALRLAVYKEYEDELCQRAEALFKDL